MTRDEQRMLLLELLAQVEQALLEKLPRVPEHWDGHELRHWIADEFRSNSVTLPKMSRRFRQFHRDVAQLGL
jgi:predicted glycoside hydrolase/deacetylase ChbG (UPF0249 family)